MDRISPTPRSDPSLGAIVPNEGAVWKDGSLLLTYRLGDVTLFARRFPALVLHSLPLALAPDAAPRPPLSRLGKDAAVLVARSLPVVAALPTLSSVDGVLRYVMRRYRRQYVDLTGTFDAYLGTFSGKTRSTLRRKVRRFLALGGGAHIRAYRHAGDMAEFHRLARMVSVRTYQEKLLGAGLPGDAAFLQELVDLASEDAVRAYLLMLDDQPIAYLCCRGIGDVLLYSYVGYDPRHATFSPGTVLQYLALESLFVERRFRAFDFTEGEGEHKTLFATDEILCADICYFAPAAAAYLWVGLHLATDWFSSSVGRVLAHLGVKAGIRRLIRHRLTRAA